MDIKGVNKDVFPTGVFLLMIYLVWQGREVCLCVLLLSDTFDSVTRFVFRGIQLLILAMFSRIAAHTRYSAIS